jgi:hypothetical protein
MRWQAGRNVCVEVQTARGDWIMDEAFHVIAWVSTLVLLSVFIVGILGL